MTAIRLRAARSKTADPVLAEATELALDAAVEEAGGAAFVGEPLGITAEDDRVVVHSFACRLPAYRGWYWAVVLTRAPRSKVVTVDEVVLLPGEGAMLAPDWVPWSDRIQAGDLGVGDLLPTAADDPRLALRLTDVDELSDDLPFFELGLGRARVLSLEGRELAASRWYEGDPGPSAASAAPLRPSAAPAGSTFAWSAASAGCSGCAATSSLRTTRRSSPTITAAARTPRRWCCRRPTRSRFRSTTTRSRPSRKPPPSPRSRCRSRRGRGAGRVEVESGEPELLADVAPEAAEPAGTAAAVDDPEQS